MGLRYKNLDAKTREFMLEELELDVKNGRVYVSPRLNPRGQKVWVELLREAIAEHDDDWLADQLRAGEYIREYEYRRLRNGKEKLVRVPKNAPQTLAEGEFNRYYIRGLCARAIAEGIDEVVVYRGKAVKDPRTESQAKIGKRFNARVLLRDLRNSTGVEPALGLPPGPNSGLTVCLPECSDEHG